MKKIMLALVCFWVGISNAYKCVESETYQIERGLIPIQICGSYDFSYWLSIDGYPITRDKHTRIVYASISSDYTFLYPTEHPYNGEPIPKEYWSMAMQLRVEPYPPMVPFVSDITLKLDAKNKELRMLNSPPPEEMNVFGTRSHTFINDTGHVNGVVIPITFYDIDSLSGIVFTKFSRDSLDSAYNHEWRGLGYTESLNEYWTKQSNGKVNVTNDVLDYFTPSIPRKYYAWCFETGQHPNYDLAIDSARYYAGTGDTISEDIWKNIVFTYRDSMERARPVSTLVNEVLTHLDTLNNAVFDVSQLSLDANGNALSVAIQYVGGILCDLRTRSALWPHKGGIWPPVVIDSVKFSKKLITNMGSNMALGTVAHEQGHLLFAFPDLYDRTDPKSTGIGEYGLMGSGNYVNNQRHPPMINAGFRYEQGWITPIEWDGTGQTIRLEENSNEFLRVAKDSNEYYIMQYINKDRTLPDKTYWFYSGSGLLAWHIDFNITTQNDDPSQLDTAHYLVQVVEADANWKLLEIGDNRSGESGDLFTELATNSWTTATAPSTLWWDGTSSEFDILSIDTSGTEMILEIDDNIEPLIPVSFGVTGNGHWSISHYYGTYPGVVRGSSPRYTVTPDEGWRVKRITHMGQFVSNGFPVEGSLHCPKLRNRTRQCKEVYFRDVQNPLYLNVEFEEGPDYSFGTKHIFTKSLRENRSLNK